jgi:hypothetical protein
VRISVVSVGLLLGLVVLAACGSPPSTPLATGGEASTGTAGAANQDAARAAAQQLVDAVLLPAGATRSSTPASALSDAISPPIGGSNHVQASTYWTVPHAEADEVSTFLTTHAVPGTKESGTGSSFDTKTTAPPVEAVMYDGTATAAYAAPRVEVAVVQDGDDVAVRADAYLTWRPVRSATTMVTGTVTSIVATSTTGGNADIRGAASTPQTATITDPARTAPLVAKLNALAAAAPMGPHSCPPGAQGDSLELEVHTADHVWAFVESGCSFAVGVTVDGKGVSPALDASTFGDLVASALG